MGYIVTVIVAQTFDKEARQIAAQAATRGIVDLVAKATRRAGGCTFSQRNGAWLNAEGATLTEAVTQLDVCIPPEAGENVGQTKRRALAIGQELAEYAKTMFNQESVVLYITRGHVEFI